jgi:hypothetical protein
MRGLPRILRDLFSGTDNNSIEMGRTLWALSVLAAIVLQGVAVAKGQPFNAIEFGGGVAALLAAGGFGVAQKDKALAKVQEAAE